MPTDPTPAPTPTPDDVEQRMREIREREQAAMKGPWVAEVSGDFIHVRGNKAKPPIVNWQGFDDSFRSISKHQANAAFMAASRDDVPWLLAQLAAARAALKLACDRIADSEQSYEEANTSDGWRDVFLNCAAGRDTT